MSKHNVIMDVSTERKVFIGIGLFTILVLVGGIWLISASDKKQQEKLSKSLVGEEIQIQNVKHVKPGETHEGYNSNPPTNGPMYDEVAGAGIHDQEVADEKVVHSMEHGAAVVWYKPDLPKEDIERITQAFNGVSGKKVMLPRQDMATPIVLTSWGRLLKLESIDEGKIKEFIVTNEDRGPEKSSMI